MIVGKAESQRFYEAAVTVPTAVRDIISCFIIENFAAGVVLDEKESGNEVSIIFHVPEAEGTAFRENLASYISSLNAMPPVMSDDISIRIVCSTEWETSFQNTIKPVIIDRIVVKPPWVKKRFKSKIELIIEPKMSFGTGHHETTARCIREIQKYLRPGQCFYDLGCGTGILAILAAKLGAVVVKGVDIDVAAVENAKENVMMNRVTDRVTIKFGSLTRSEKPSQYDFLAANILKKTIVESYENIDRVVRPGGCIVLSGLLKEDCDDMRCLLKSFKYPKYNINQDGQWFSYTVFK
ncbi:MAG: 50S ribosomal protein L11 methyltransferase [Candidatus Zixiibacteriota bacterium]|nr:MAG: 50S ribosomal protein L11 methyltransferase [candidate division Zixibacteria bacterium]